MILADPNEYRLRNVQSECAVLYKVYHIVNLFLPDSLQQRYLVDFLDSVLVKA